MANTRHHVLNIAVSHIHMSMNSLTSQYCATFSLAIIGNGRFRLMQHLVTHHLPRMQSISGTRARNMMPGLPRSDETASIA